MEIVLIIIGLIVVFCIIAIVVYIVKMIILSIVSVLSFLIGLAWGFIQSFRMFGIWAVVFITDFHSPFGKVSDGRNAILSKIEKERGKPVEEIDWDHIEQITDNSSNVGQTISFFVTSIVFTSVLGFLYGIIYFIYYVLCTVMSLVLGGLLAIVQIPYYYLRSVIFRRIGATISRANNRIQGFNQRFHQHQVETKKNKLPNVQWYMLITYNFGAYIMLTVNTVIHMVLFLLFAPVILTLLAIVKIGEEIYMSRNKMFTVCPSCLHKMKIPDYQCKGCNSIHKVGPSFYHILYKKCECGHHLPTSLLSGRKKLVAVCEGCKVPMEYKENKPISIPVVGGPSVGKTTYVISTLHEYIKSIAPLSTMNVKFASQHGERTYLQYIRNMEKGIFPDKTVAAVPFDFNLIVNQNFSRKESMLSLYDFAGEVYTDSKSVSQYEVFEYFDGLVFIIDPFSIPAIIEKYQKQEGFTNVSASETNLSDTFDVMVLYLEKYFNIKPMEKVTKPCTFIINKLDAFDLNEHIGEPAITRYMNEKNMKISDKGKVSHLVCKQFLEENGEENFVMRVEHKFKNFRFFACSSLPGANQKHIEGTEDPFRWMLKQIDKKLVYRKTS